MVDGCGWGQPSPEHGSGSYATNGQEPSSSLLSSGICEDAASRRSSVDAAVAGSALVVLHRCRLGGPPEMETVVFGSATSLCPETTVAIHLPRGGGSGSSFPDPWAVTEGSSNCSLRYILGGGDDCCAAPALDASASLPSLPTSPSGRASAAAAAAAAKSAAAAAAAARPAAPAAAGRLAAVNGGAPSLSGPLPDALAALRLSGELPRTSFDQAPRVKSRRSSTSSFGSSAWLTSLASEQALLDCESLWVGRDRPEPAVRGGQRKGAGIARPRSYPAHLCSAAATAAAGAADAPPAINGEPLSLGAAAASALAAQAAAGVRWGPTIHHSASAPAGAVAGALATATSDACAAGLKSSSSSDDSPLARNSGCSGCSAGRVSDMGTVRGGESPSETLEGCVRGGVRRRASALLRSSSLESQLLRSASARSLPAAGGSTNTLARTHSLPARSQSVRCFSGAAASAAAPALPASGAAGAASAPLRSALCSARSMPCRMPGSTSQLELLQSPEDSLLGLSIVRVRLGSAADVADPLEQAASAATAAVPPPRGPAAQQGTCAWRPSAALAAAAAAVGTAPSTAAAPAPGQLVPPQAAALRPAEPGPARHQGLDQLQQRRVQLEEALSGGWASAEPEGLPLVAEEP